MHRRPITRSISRPIRSPHRRGLRVAAATLALAVLASACGGGSGGGSSNAANSARGPITVWYSNNEQELAWGKAMVAAWNADHPNEQVTGQEIPAGKSSEEVIGAAITAGTAPCLVFNTAPSAVGQFQRMGGLVNLADFEGGAAYVTDRSGPVADQYKAADGGFYQLPWKSNPVMIFYNKKMFAAAGLDPEQPKLSSYEEFLTAARAIKAKKAAQFAINPAPTSEFFQSQFDFMPMYAAQTGGKGLVENDQATFGDQNGIDVFEFWQTIYAEGLAGKEQIQGDAFADGKSAMAIVGPWAVSVYKGKVDWGSVPVPTKAGTSADQTFTFGDAKNIGLYSACQNRATAFDLMKFATSEAQDGQLLQVTGQMPLRKDLASVYADYFTKNPAYKQFGDQASRTVEVPGGPNTVEMLQTIRDAWTRSVITGQGDVPAAVTGAAEKVTQLAGQG